MANDAVQESQARAEEQRGWMGEEEEPSDHMDVDKPRDPHGKPLLPPAAQPVQSTSVASIEEEEGSDMDAEGEPDVEL